MRLQKYIAKAGVSSRRKAEELILSKRVQVNGELIDTLGTKVDEYKDQVKVDGKVIKIEYEKKYILLNKPIGYITTLDDEFDRNTILDLIKGVDKRVYPVGRLDRDTEGLLLMTNDGDLTFRLTHPSFEMNKVYLAKIKGIPSEEEMTCFREGLIIEGQKTWPAEIKIISNDLKSSLVEITIHEGRNRQVRKMCDKINHPVISLKRIKFGPISLNGLRLGEYRELSQNEINMLKEV